jgi:hypothetical protein
MAHANMAPLSERDDDTFCLHLLVSRPNGAQLLAIPLTSGLSEEKLRQYVERVLLDIESPILGAISDEALDAALRESSDGG